jgi:hypothetical protein
MGGACSTHGRIKNYILVGKHEGKDHLEDLGVEVTIILKRMLKEIEQEVVDWIHLGQERDQWGGGDSCEHDNESSDFI